ncbi:hypothetical protein B0H14DRAFT_2591398 [Mycena olivaceomarginata]|nr:hypothetical protein B0H14DRAFT_2591398 [Mycena olivaceomarginata]
MLDTVEDDEKDITCDIDGRQGAGSLKDSRTSMVRKQAPSCYSHTRELMCWYRQKTQQALKNRKNKCCGPSIRAYEYQYNRATTTRAKFWRKNDGGRERWDRIMRIGTIVAGGIC